MAVEPATNAAQRMKPADCVVAIAASAGGLAAISRVLGCLRETLEAAVIVVQHLDPARRSLLASILARRTSMPVHEAEAGEEIMEGTVYVAPPDEHFLVSDDGRVVLAHTALVHYVRPSADLLFESVAEHYGKRAIAIVLSGTGSDGAMGVRAIKARGGTVIVQDEATSDFFGMPRSAIETGNVDSILPIDDIGSAVRSLVEGGDGG